METKNQNGAAKNVNNANANGAGNKEIVLNAKPVLAENKPAITEKPVQDLAVQQQMQNPNEQPLKELPLDLRLKMVSDLHRRSVQRMNLISRMRQLEAFEIELAQGNDELEDNPYQGCKLIIRDDQNREFVTTTPGLIRMTAQYIYMACEKKLGEIESTIVFPGA